MKTKLLILIAGLIYLNSYAQIYFQEHIITINADAANSVYSEDLDGDGDYDALSASFLDNKIAWYENMDGHGDFGIEQVISFSALGAEAVHAADIDGDGDVDVLSASWIDNKLAWYENTDGQGNFGSPQIITYELDWANTIYACDLDGDGDMDVLSSSNYDWNWKIVWYENIDGQGNFGPQHIITIYAMQPSSVYACDIDGDSDLDVLSSSWFDDKIAWYENIDGTGNFGPQRVISTSIDNAVSVYAEDIDGDGDLDVLSASNFDNKISGFQNLNGNGDFGTEIIITTDAQWLNSVYAEDFDGDGDMDVLSGSNPIQWYENDGSGWGWTNYIISSHIGYANSVYACDIDKDSDIDFLTASYGTDTIAWFESSDALAIDENTKTDFIIYPNPTFDILIIESKTSIFQIEIMNQLGQFVLSNSNKNKIDLSSLKEGFYFIRITDEKGNIETNKIIKQ